MLPGWGGGVHPRGQQVQRPWGRNMVYGTPAVLRHGGGLAADMGWSLFEKDKSCWVGDRGRLRAWRRLPRMGENTGNRSKVDPCCVVTAGSPVAHRVVENTDLWAGWPVGFLGRPSELPLASHGLFGEARTRREGLFNWGVAPSVVSVMPTFLGGKQGEHEEMASEQRSNPEVGGGDGSAVKLRPWLSNAWLGPRKVESLCIRQQDV